MSTGQQPKSQSSNGPWPLSTAGIGGLPNTSLDVPVTSVFLVLFILGAITHMTILQVNRKRGKKFLINGMTFGFCMARITAATLRIAWSQHPKNISVAIAASIFMAAGVVLLFVINLIFTQRIIRATHPSWAWSTWFSRAFKYFYISIVILLVALITAAVQSFFTQNEHTRSIDRAVQQAGSTYFAIAAFLPLPLLALNFLHPRQSPMENFGEGRLRTKIGVIVVTSVILTFGAAFRAGVGYVIRPVNDPAWYHSKAVFYLINFTIEILVVILFAIARIDKLFIIPNGAKGTYMVGEQKNPGTDVESVGGDVEVEKA